MSAPSLVVALGPGEAELVPAAALDVLRAAGSCRLDAGAVHLTGVLEAAGIMLDPTSTVLAAADREALAAVRTTGAESVPPRPLLERQGTARAAGALRELTARLRAECPWDRLQDERSIVSHTIEEAYEVADTARGEGLTPTLVDELGDLLFQTTFLALLCEERGIGDWTDVIEDVSAKLVRRHPHVFGDAAAATAADVRGVWEETKRTQEGRQGIFHDVPEALPGLLHARKLQRRAATVGFEYPTPGGAFDDLRSEVEELSAELDEREPPAWGTPGDPTVDAEIGDVLFAVVNVARRWNADPELAVRAAGTRFRARVELAARLAADEGVDFASAGLEQQEGYYQAAKRALVRGRPTEETTGR
jgi:MazG family protein